MKKNIIISLLILIFATAHASSGNLDIEKKKINLNGLTTFSAFRKIENTFNVHINIKGDVQNIKLNSTYLDADLKTVVINLLKESNTSNYSLSFNNNTRILTIRTLRQHGNKSNIEPKSDSGRTKLDSFNQADIIDVKGLIEQEINDNYLNKTLTFEEIEQIKKGDMLFSQSGAGGTNDFSPEQLENLHKTTEEIKKNEHSQKNDISNHHIEQIMTEQITQEEVRLTPEQLKALQKE